MKKQLLILSFLIVVCVHAQSEPQKFDPNLRSHGGVLV